MILLRRTVSENWVVARTGRVEEVVMLTNVQVTSTSEHSTIAMRLGSISTRNC